MILTIIFLYLLFGVFVFIQLNGSACFDKRIPLAILLEKFILCLIQGPYLIGRLWVFKVRRAWDRMLIKWALKGLLATYDQLSDEDKARADESIKKAYKYLED